MQARQDSAGHSSEKNTNRHSHVINGFHFYQEAVCGYNSCSCTSPHYHCQSCGFGTSEKLCSFLNAMMLTIPQLPHAIIHKESCSSIVRSGFPQSSRLQQSGNTQAQEQPELCTPYDVGSESTITMTGSSVHSSPQITNSSNHFYCRGGMMGPQQSPGFNPLLSSQTQPLYNGVYGSQTGFSNQNNFPPSGFNTYGHVEPPPWLSDNRINSSTSGTPGMETGRSSRSLNPVCNSQGMSHACCANRIGLLEGIGICSPLSSEIYKSLNKESPSCQSKNGSNMDSQAWFCSQGMLGFGNQNIQNGGYKCSDQFPSCAMVQLSSTLHEQGDLKHSGMTESCFEQNSIAKHANHCTSESLKSGCMEQNKGHLSKYCSLQKVPLLEQSAMSIEQKQQQQQQQQEAANGYGNHAMMFGSTEGELHDEMLYSQASLMLPMGSDNHPRLPTQFLNSKTFHQSNLTESNKTFPTSQGQTSMLQQHFQVPCEVMEGCLQLENQQVFTYPQICGDEDKTSNQGSSSGACESDIVVEETEEDLTESEISIEEMKSGVSTRCLVCNTSDSRFVHMSGHSPLTSASHIPVATKLAQVVASDCSPVLPLQDDLICRRCLNLIDTVDCLENKLASAKQDIIQLYKGRVVVLKPPENWEKDVSKGEAENKNDTLPTEIDSELTTVLSQQNSEKEEERTKVEENHTEDKTASTDVEIVDNATKEEEREEDDDSSSTNVDEDTLSKEDSNDKFQCNICRKNLSSKEYLHKHIQQHTKEFSFYCDRCGRGFMLRTGLENHLLMHAGEYRYQCEVCGKCFIRRHALEDHLRKHQGAFKLSCDECGKGFMYSSSLRIHQRTHTGERPFVCEHCGKGFGSTSNLTVHVRVCSGELPFLCNRCGGQFASSSQMQAHIVAQHEGRFRSQCNVCGKGFTKLCDLKAHARTHSGEKPHRCVTCGKCYSSVGNLNQHAKMHEKDRPFKCSLCNKGFLRRSVLTRHMNQHAGVRPFKCDQCGKTYVSSHDLHAHHKWHTGTIKRQTCPVCGKSMNHGLKVHMRTHTGYKPYECSECKAAFTVKSTLNKHIKLKHQQVT